MMMYGTHLIHMDNMRVWVNFLKAKKCENEKLVSVEVSLIEHNLNSDG